MAHRLAPEARTDLDEIWFYIASQGSADNADRLVESLTKRFFLLRRHPRAGRRRDDLRVDLRTFAVGNYLVVYRVDGADAVGLPSSTEVEISRRCSERTKRKSLLSNCPLDGGAYDPSSLALDPGELRRDCAYVFVPRRSAERREGGPGAPTFAPLATGRSCGWQAQRRLSIEAAQQRGWTFSLLICGGILAWTESAGGEGGGRAIRTSIARTKTD